LVYAAWSAGVVVSLLETRKTMTTVSGSEVIKPLLSESDNDDNLVHIMCCRDNDVALCGTDISDAPILDDGWYEEDCVVCDNLGDLKKKTRCQVCPTSRGDVTGL
jgi:hypothetical protein